MLIAEFEVIAQIRLYNQHNGGTIGQGWGEFVYPSLNDDKEYFTTGEWVFFSREYAKENHEFKQHDGFCEMKGPYKQHHLAFCVNDCEDFETLE